MWLSTVGRCALSAMVDLALYSDQAPILPRDLAGRQRIPDAILSRLLFYLEQAHLIRIVRGSNSGYRLARDAAAIGVGDILQVVEKRMAPAFSADSTHGSAFPPIDRDPVHWLSARMDQAVREILSSLTLADLCTRSEVAILHPGRSQKGPVETRLGKLHGPRGSLLSVLDNLEVAHAFRQSIFDGLPEAVMVIDTDYHVVLMNRAARRFASIGIDTPDPMLCYQISHRRDTPCEGLAHPCPLGQIRESGRQVTVVHEHYRADGEQRLIELNASPLWGEDGHVQGIIESSRDITERSRAEQSLQEYAERLRALAERLDEVAENERLRLSRELHDQVGQNLTALGINLNIVRTQMPGDVVPAVRSRLDDSLMLVQQTTEQIRDVMAHLRPAVLDDYGLLSALRWYADQFARRTNLAVAVKSEMPVPRLDGRIESALFRIAQEALTNISKHAQASQVTVTVEIDDQTLRLVVADDGNGFDPEHLAEPGRGRGWGLLTMSERAEAVGGHCLIESYPGLGTRVVVDVVR